MNKQKLEQRQYQKLNPKQIQFLGLLQIPVISLEKRVEEELEENPVLEEEEEKEEEINLNNSSYYNKNFKNHENFSLESSESFSQHLTKQLIGLDLNDNLLFLSNYIINSLDDNGYLTRDLYSISSDLLANYSVSISEEEIKNALSVVKNLEPCGVGAKDLKECLLLQLNKYHKSNNLAYKIIKSHYSKFSNKNFEYLIKTLNITRKELKTIYTLIERLEPIPSSGFSKNNSKPIDYIHPDFIITIVNNKIQLHVKKNESKKLKISKYYSDLVKKTEDKATRSFLKNKIEKANWFIEAIEKRHNTLKKVMLAIIELQKKYFFSGNEEDLVPMKLADVASIVNMDISTISRVSNSKYIETHFGTFKVKELFSEAYRKDNGEIISTKEIISALKEIIKNEDKKRPFTDEELAEILGKEDYHIARRTTSKYRDQLNIKPAKLRRVL